MFNKTHKTIWFSFIFIDLPFISFLYEIGDVGALSEVRDELLHNVLEPIAHPERFRSLGLEVPAGVLFFGPPGLVLSKLSYLLFSSIRLCSHLSSSLFISSRLLYFFHYPRLYFSRLLSSLFFSSPFTFSPPILFLSSFEYFILTLL